ncbi:MAG TPA: carboxypeptidase regulatory-like domain-containing protein [Bryobacteraceae bacterium]|nr:carboxypeptidase regulatory-like domain-containing protein [Bryobacteraceae bacterium]
MTPRRTILLLLAAVASLHSQTSGAISGSVTDPSGGAVANAAITLTDTDTGSVRNTITGASGYYQADSLPVGNYEIRASKNAFASELRTGISLAVGQSAVVDFTLKIGQTSEIVTVRGDAPLVGSTTADISGLVSGHQIRDLPLNGRSFDELMTLNPGVVNFTAEKIGGVGVSNSTNGNNFAVSGNRPQQNLYLLNGVEFTGAAENNMQPGGVSQQLLGVDAVAEFNLLRDSYSAQYGKHPGGQVVLVTRGGSNELHGSLYEFLRNNALDARNFFNGPSVPGFQRNQFGAALGGPVKRDQTFLFANWEGFRQHLHQAGVDLVPDNNARSGYLPCTLVTPAPASCSAGLAFVGVSPLINAWPAPTPGAPDFGGIAEAFNNPLQTIRDDFGTVRMDHNFSNRDSLTGVYTIDDSSSFTPTASNAYMTDAESLREQVASLHETHVFSPVFLNSLTFGYSRGAYFFTGEPTPGTPAASLPGFLSGDPLGALNVGGSSASNPAAAISLAGANNGSNLHVDRNIFTYEDHVAMTRGIHQISAGVWFQRLQSNELLALSQYGQDTFTSLQTFLQGTGTLVYDPAPTPLGWRTTMGAFYAQDSIRFSPRLIATAGYRQEFDTGWNEARGRASNYQFTNGVINAQPTIGSSVFSVNHAKFLPQPRLGLAWTPISGARKTVLRAAFGMYDDLQDALGYRTDQNAPFNPTYSLAGAQVAQFPLSQSAPVPAAAKLVPGGVQPNLQTPTLLSWSFRVEQEITESTALTAGYIGSHGYHELVGVDANEPFPVMCPAPGCPAVYPANFPAPLAGASIPAGTYYNPSSTKPTPSLGPTWTYFSEGDSSYQALQIDLTHRFTHNFTARGVYTWSKVIDDGDSPNSTTSGNEPALVSNPFDLRADRGLGNFDVRNAAVISLLYQFPAWRNRLASGWSVGSIVTLQSGFPFTPQLSYNPSNSGDTKNPVRPFVNPNFTGNVITGSPNQWFNPAAFLAPPNNSGFWGNLGRDTLIGPGLATWDFSLHKDTHLRERLNVQFRAELFNLLNHANFNTPNPVVFTPSLSPTAGLITSTSTTSRQIQFGLKLLW